MTGRGGAMGREQVHYNRDLLRGNHSRGVYPWCPLVPPRMFQCATLKSQEYRHIYEATGMRIYSYVA